MLTVATWSSIGNRVRERGLNLKFVLSMGAACMGVYSRIE